MVYIHRLQDLTQKSADIESVPIVRELRARLKMPLIEDAMLKEFVRFFVEEHELESLQEALDTIPLAIEATKALLEKNDPLYERVNLQRALQMFNEMPSPLQANLALGRDIVNWQGTFATEATEILNAIPHLKTHDEKKAYNDRLNNLFLKLLRNTEMHFRYNDLIHEGQTNTMLSFSESMAKGFYFHVTLEMELKKIDYRRNTPYDKLPAVDAVTEQVKRIKRGVDYAYAINLRMIDWALHLYAYFKWVMMG
ncbi:hypothetical protein HZB02_00810 [Candidatus Woesearchaeota archaeon]|nr:hypothetical protein [Candidatus Woesearchaeota archaeon]